DPFILGLIRYHCPIVSILKFAKPNPTSFIHRIELHDKRNYAAFRERSLVDFSALTSDFDVRDRI
ncbi:hypothetical protein DPMN_074819, partial [Dreissena polymorpha]